jgi:hypothetical protein
VRCFMAQGKLKLLHSVRQHGMFLGMFQDLCEATFCGMKLFKSRSGVCLATFFGVFLAALCVLLFTSRLHTHMFTCTLKLLQSPCYHDFKSIGSEVVAAAFS